MTPRFETLPGKKLIGKRLTMSLAQNRTAELWQSFMQTRRQIRNAAGPDLYSIQVYPPDYFTAFSPAAAFEKQAAIEVTGFENVPDGMEAITLPGGLYAVFSYKGPAGAAAPFEYIFGQWLPASGYKLDNRPHFELLGSKYQNNHPDSEEEIWIPVTKM